jgi:hypothetical protein
LLTVPWACIVSWCSITGLNMLISAGMDGGMGYMSGMLQVWHGGGGMGHMSGDVITLDIEGGLWRLLFGLSIGRGSSLN